MRKRVGRMGLLAVLFLWACGEAAEQPSPLEVRRMQLEGVAYLEENLLYEAEAAFRRVLDLAPRDAAAHADLGMVYLRMGRLDEAQEHLREAVALTPDDPEPRLVLARVLWLQGDRGGAREELETALVGSPDHRPSLHALARLDLEQGDPDALARAARGLEHLVELMEGNSVLLLELTGVLLRSGDADGAAARLEELRRQLPGFPTQGEAVFEEALDRSLEGDRDGALEALDQFHDAMSTTGRYQADLRALRDPGGVLGGVPTVTLRGRGPEGLEPEEVAAGVRFVDATDTLIPETPPPRRVPAPGEAVGLAVRDFTGNGLPDIYVGSGLLFRNEGHRFVEMADEAGIPSDLMVVDAAAGDLTGNGHPDLYLVRPGADLLLRNDGTGSFGSVTGAGIPGGSWPGSAALLADVDHDGDLDVVAVGDGVPRLYRNNLDDTFQEIGLEAGIASAAGGTSMAFADLNDSDVLDLVVARQDGPPAILLNQREGRFRDGAEEMGLGSLGGATSVAVGDYDNDGHPDLFVAGIEPGERRLFRNVEGSRFEVDDRPRDLYAALSDLRISQAVFLDFDNDGWLDLLVAGEPEDGGGRGLRLFRNAGPGEWHDLSSSLPQLGSVSRVVAYDLFADGDLDLVVSLSDGSVRVLRNEGGNVNHSLSLRLVALGMGAGRNNHHGIGAQVEVRAGSLYQVRFVTDPVTVIGLGNRPQADVVRVRWPNGMPQVIHFPDAQASLVEEQLLLGSCPFLYAWDGESYEFVTDVLWQSALGMPVGIGGLGEGNTYAPPWPSRQWIRVPGDRVTLRDGEIHFQFTNELWETTYLDEVRLEAVDHPESVELWTHEGFPAADPDGSLTLHPVRTPRPPASAFDERGRDLLPLLREHDFRYVSNLRPGPYQGIVELHDLILDLGPVPEGEEVRLFLRGWIFPTDASINVALAQSEAVEAIPPYLQVRNDAGEWVTVIEDLGFPAGKDKTVVAELTGLFPGDDRGVRIRTNLEVYWDHIFVEVGKPDLPLRPVSLAVVGADLWERGFSRTYRKGGRYGPHWFDWDVVSRESPWQPIRGLVTRTGNVLSLLREADDRTVVMAPGDAIHLRFDARDLPPLPAGWTRTYFFRPVGWVKDANLNTATGDHTDPLPFHGMSRYPYGPDQAFPDTSRHREYLDTYLTRRPGEAPR